MISEPGGMRRARCETSSADEAEGYRSAERLPKVIDQVRAVFEAHGDADQVVGDTHGSAEVAGEAGV